MYPWYITLRAADRTRISVLELEKVSNADWVYRGIVAEAAEAEAEEARRAHNEWRRKNGMPEI